MEYNPLLYFYILGQIHNWCKQLQLNWQVLKWGQRKKWGYKVSSAYIRNAFVLFVLPLHLLVILGMRPAEAGESLNYTEGEQFGLANSKELGNLYIHGAGHGHLATDTKDEQSHTSCW